jgi:hypothetical protein
MLLAGCVAAAVSSLFFTIPAPLAAIALVNMHS